MREHEVPTHVQAEDKVLLWFTFPQVVAMTAVGALAYGAYRYMPPSGRPRRGWPWPPSSASWGWRWSSGRSEDGGCCLSPPTC